MKSSKTTPGTRGATTEVVKANHPQNPKKTDGGKFPKGKSANPGGRPKGLANLVRSKTGDGQELVDTMVSIARGKLRIEDTYTDKQGNEHSVSREPSHKDRIAAIEWLADRGFGKAVASLEISGPEGAAIKIERVLSDEELLAIAAKGVS